VKKDGTVVVIHHKTPLHIMELGGITSTTENASLQELGLQVLCLHCSSWPVLVITAETKWVAASWYYVEQSSECSSPDLSGWEPKVVCSWLA